MSGSQSSQVDPNIDESYIVNHVIFETVGYGNINIRVNNVYEVTIIANFFFPVFCVFVGWLC